ncbi:MAG: VWA domain-containing protein [Rhodothermales bacterium]
MRKNTAGKRPATPLADHIVAFGRVLRRAGLKVGSHQIMDALRAVELVGVRRQDDVYQALFNVFVQRREQVELFEQAFHLFWRAPSQLPDLMAMLLPQTDVPPPERPKQQTRAHQALTEAGKKNTGIRPRPSNEEKTKIEFLATYSADEVLRKKDFADFTVEEVAAARAFIRHMRWPIEPHRVRRHSPREKGRRLHMRGTMRRALHHHGELLDLRYQGPKKKMRPVVVLCDISGSMEPYARMLLHFMHAVTGGLRRVESFVFGTRLTRITRYLRRRDVDDAVGTTAREVNDWAGGTRIGEALKEFNYTWLRRVLRSGGVVLIISDGCDRGDTDLLGREMARLARNCHRLIWLNPLLGYEAYQPLTRGMQAALPHIDDFLPVHNLDSLQQLGEILAGLPRAPELSWRAMYDGNLAR